MRLSPSRAACAANSGIGLGSAGDDRQRSAACRIAGSSGLAACGGIDQHVESAVGVGRGTRDDDRLARRVDRPKSIEQHFALRRRGWLPTPRRVDGWRQQGDVLRRDAETSLHSLAQGAVGTKMRLAFSAACWASDRAARLVGAGRQLGAPGRDDIGNAGFQRQLGIPPEMAGVDHMRIEIVDFAIESEPPRIAIAGQSGRR